MVISRTGPARRSWAKRLDPVSTLQLSARRICLNTLYNLARVPLRKLAGVSSCTPLLINVYQRSCFYLKPQSTKRAACCSSVALCKATHFSYPLNNKARVRVLYNASKRQVSTVPDPKSVARPFWSHFLHTSNEKHNFFKSF